MTAEDLKKWNERIAHLAAANMEPSWYDLTLAMDAIARSPWSHITDAMLRVNGGWLSDERYDRVLSALLHDGALSAGSFQVFSINRRKIPQVKVESVWDALIIGQAPANVAPQVIASEPPPSQWELF